MPIRNTLRHGEQPWDSAILIALSDHTAQIVERASQGVVAVHGGGRSSGIN
jgi:hypothetical protein